MRSIRPALTVTRIHLRSIPAVMEKSTFLGTGAEAGADEDDFHTFKRKSAEVDKEQKAVERIQKKKKRVIDF